MRKMFPFGDVIMHRHGTVHTQVLVLHFQNREMFENAYIFYVSKTKKFEKC